LCGSPEHKFLCSLNNFIRRRQNKNQYIHYRLQNATYAHYYYLKHFETSAPLRTPLAGCRIQFKLGVTVHRCLQGNAPQYLVDCCKSTTDVASHQRLRSASRHQLIVPWHRHTKFGRRVFSVAGSTAWNSLPDYLRDPSLSEHTCRRSLKTYSFALD